MLCLLLGIYISSTIFWRSILQNLVGVRMLEVEGLHEQLDFILNLNPGINIIYGKNGRGKTTALHILVNALELDFKRFESLNFRRISILTFSNNQLEIIKVNSDDLSVLMDGEVICRTSDSYVIAAPVVMYLREKLGPRPTYLPAFRSVLERVRGEYAVYPNKEVETEEITSKEFLALREVATLTDVGVREIRTLREEAEMTGRKTSQCRQWFGAFVPVVRYPSIVDVENGLTNEWRNAQLKMGQREQAMFGEVFVKVFRTIVGLDKSEISNVNADNLLDDIGKFLITDDAQSGQHGPSAIYQQLREATDFFRAKDDHQQQTTERSVLNLYYASLAERELERTNAFQRSRDFEESVNKFLDKKRLRIGATSSARQRSAVNVSTEGGRAYGLASLSSGEKQILTMLYSASRSRFKTGMFLIDEPELSLHIDWQRKILNEIMALTPGNQIIACTHSPEVGADHLLETQDFEPKVSPKATADLFGLSADDEEE